MQLQFPRETTPESTGTTISHELLYALRQRIFESTANADENEVPLIRGIEMVLLALEDRVNDRPGQPWPRNV